MFQMAALSSAGRSLHDQANHRVVFAGFRPVGTRATELARVCRENELVIETWSPIHLRAKLKELLLERKQTGGQGDGVLGRHATLFVSTPPQVARGAGGRRCALALSARTFSVLLTGRLRADTTASSSARAACRSMMLCFSSKRKPPRSRATKARRRDTARGKKRWCISTGGSRRLRRYWNGRENERSRPGPACEGKIVPRQRGRRHPPWPSRVLTRSRRRSSRCLARTRTRRSASHWRSMPNSRPGRVAPIKRKYQRERDELGV